MHRRVIKLFLHNNEAKSQSELKCQLFRPRKRVTSYAAAAGARRAPPAGIEWNAGASSAHVETFLEHKWLQRFPAAKNTKKRFDTKYTRQRVNLCFSSLPLSGIRGAEDSDQLLIPAARVAFRSPRRARPSQIAQGFVRVRRLERVSILQ